jgi:RNA polymerase sigma factor (sigma-70 family)
MLNSLEKLSDEEIVSGLEKANGDSGKYFSALYSKYSLGLYKHSLSILKNKEEAEDHVHDTFILLYEKFNGGKYNEIGNFKSWLFTVNRNNAVDKLRKRKENVFNFSEYFKYLDEDMNEEEFFAKFLDLYDSPEDEKIKKDRNEKISESLDNLKSQEIDFGKFLNMYYFQDKKYKDIEKETGLPINTVKSRIRRAKQLLEPKISDYNPLS